MTIDAGTYYTLTCDTCGERMEQGDYGGYLVVESLKEAARTIEDAEWEKDDDDKLKCESCIEEAEGEARRAAA